MIIDKSNNTIYKFKSIDQEKLDQWILDNQEIVKRCVFNSNWSWNGGYYKSKVDIDLHGEEVTTPYLMNSNTKFLERHRVQMNIGHFVGELSHQLGRILDKYKISASSSMGIKDNCICYRRSGSIETITKISDIIRDNFKLKTKVDKISKGYYCILIHNDQAFFRNMQLEVLTKETISNKVDRKLSLVKKQSKLLNQLEKIQSELNEFTNE